MRQEDLEIDGPDLEQAEERKRETELVEEKEDELYDLDGLPEQFAAKERSEEIIAIMRAILEGDHVVINDLELPKRQLVALEALKAAVEGKDTRLSRFVYAEDRRALLEQSLAVLQPELATMYGGDQFKEMFDQIGELREKLNYLEDSEEELVEGRFKDAIEEASDTGDKDGDDDDDDGDDKSLDGPERPVTPKGPSTLTTGPERKEPAKGQTTLTTGPERKEPARGPTTLGDPKEIAQAAASEPRWRKSGN